MKQMKGKKYIVEQNPMPIGFRIVFQIISAFFSIGFLIFVYIKGIVIETIALFILLIFLWWCGLQDKPYKFPLYDVDKIYEVKLKEVKGGNK